MAPSATTVSLAALAGVVAAPQLMTTFALTGQPCARAVASSARAAAAPARSAPSQTALQLASGSLVGLAASAALKPRRANLRPRTSTGLKAELNTPAVPKRNLPQEALFDPLGLSDPSNFPKSRKLELVVGRLAMLGAVGLPLAEMTHESLAVALGLPNQLAEGNRAPALHTGGIFSPGVEVSIFTVSVLLCVAAIGATKKKDKDGLDIVTPAPELSQPWLSPLLRGMMGEAEITNGRVAMIAVVIMCLQEMVTGTAVVTPVTLA